MNKVAKKHTVDVLFVITLFFVFAFSVISLTGVGANVYQNVVNDMSDSYSSRISFSYFINKVRQGDTDGNVSVSTYKGNDSIVINEEIDNIKYSTYLYAYEGSVMELFTRADNEFDPSFGTAILEVDAFSIDKISDSLFRINISPKGLDKESVLIHIRSSK